MAEIPSMVPELPSMIQDSSSDPPPFAPSRRVNVPAPRSPSQPAPTIYLRGFNCVASDPEYNLARSVTGNVQPYWFEETRNPAVHYGPSRRQRRQNPTRRAGQVEDTYLVIPDTEEAKQSDNKNTQREEAKEAFLEAMWPTIRDEYLAMFNLTSLAPKQEERMKKDTMGFLEEEWNIMEEERRAEAEKQEEMEQRKPIVRLPVRNVSDGKGASEKKFKMKGKGKGMVKVKDGSGVEAKGEKKASMSQRLRKVLAMESRQPPPERSSSNDYIDETQLSFNKLEAQRWDRALESSQRALNQSMNLPGYHDFCNYSAPVRGCDVQGSPAWSEGNVSGGGGDDTFQSPSSDTTVKMDDGCRFSQVGEMYAPGPALNVAIPRSETGATNGSASSGSDISPLSQRQSFAGVAVESPFRPEFGGPVQTPASHGMRWSSAQLQKEISRKSDSFYSNPNIAKTHVPSRPQSTFPIPRNMPFEEMIVPRGPNLHQRRLDARASSSPGIPSPLGPGRMREQLHAGDVENVSLSPVPNGRLHTSDQMKYGKHNSSNKDTKNVWQNTPSPHSPTVQRYASSGSIDSPMFDVYPRSAEIDEEGNLTLGGSPYSNGSGHARKHTDPFVDHMPFQVSTGSTTRMCGVGAPGWPFPPAGTRPPSVHPSMYGGTRPPFHNLAGIQMCGSNNGISWDPKSPEFVGMVSVDRLRGSNSGFDTGSQSFNRPPFVNARTCGTKSFDRPSNVIVCEAPLHTPSPSETRMNGTFGKPFKPSLPFGPIAPSSQSFGQPIRGPSTATWPTSAPATSGFVTPASTEAPHSTHEPSFHARLPLRSNLPIPPPPLSSISGQYEQSPEARARLDAQKPIRSAWIRGEASKIAQLAKLRHAMEKRYEETRSDKDYAAWQTLQAAYDDATDLEKRQEERRNLFLREKKMQALKTDSTEDMSLASRGTPGVDGEEKLLGYKMALMERVCAEVKPNGEEEAITVEMLATLSKEEKKAIRKLLVGRMERMA
ncbi:uncharacterized protein J4E92_011044 [Alternaria infectoria]|uniref:uncharacterized protein n=1 Tax=Alternaria infectoria TaxID=45303 RepID=UPI00221ED0D2|nr:uncharacterized protein J4E92_011044 [Alternaria infectoria]KAI4907642.1 hypothetical protein J4E92_011044 [Alternaria infectoria]